MSVELKEAMYAVGQTAAIVLVPFVIIYMT